MVSSQFMGFRSEIGCVDIGAVEDFGNSFFANHKSGLGGINGS
jgi:hypothetical protein